MSREAVETKQGLGLKQFFITFGIGWGKTGERDKTKNDNVNDTAINDTECLKETAINDTI